MSFECHSCIGFGHPLAIIYYLNVIGESHELRIVRQALQSGELTATIVSRSLDPADSSLIRPGRRARLRALVNGVPKRIRVCTSCLQAGKVIKNV
jgi:hypothetical protein